MEAKRIPATMAMQTRPELMNASPFHSKVRVSLKLSDPLFVAGGVISGKMEMECRADTGLGIGVMMVELFAIQELTSRDHSATSTFLHSQRLFQGPGLPPSNAVLPYPIPGDPPLPQHYHQARRGQTTFFFQIPTPSSSPASIDFGKGLACVRYEVRCTVGVAWKGERRLVVDKKAVDVVESYEEDDFARIDPEGTIIGENGKIWVQGKVLGGLVVAGESACVELQVKNHSAKKTTGLQVTLTRTLHLPNLSASEKAPLHITDTLTTVAFRGPEYLVQPGTEGVASLVFDVPRSARSVKGGPRSGDAEDNKLTDCLFEVRCTLGIKIGLPLGSKDITLDLPVTIIHPLAIPQLLASPEGYVSPNPYGPPDQTAVHPSTSPNPYFDRAHSPYAYPALPLSPPIPHQYLEHMASGQMWFPPPQSHTPNPYQYFSPPLANQQYYFPPPPPQPIYVAPPRPLSAEPSSSQTLHALPSGLPAYIDHQPQQHLMQPLDAAQQQQQQPITPEEGKGERASRIANHLRMSSRHRSVSPQSHRFPLPVANAAPAPVHVSARTTRNLSPPSNLQAPLHLNLAGLSTFPLNEDGVVYAPRPMISPKHSYTSDPMKHNSLPKSERVEELERMAEEVVQRKKDLSDDLPVVAQSDIDKTLPKPPVPSGKINLLSSPPGSNRQRVDAVFSSNIRQSALAPVDEAPPTPMLTAVTPLRLPRAVTGLSASLDQGNNEGGLSGLDALERKLLAEVGTRKVEKDDRRADVRSVLPIAIPAPAPEPLNDSAISSLSLADHENDHDHERDRDSDERTHQPGRHSPSDDDRDVIARRRRVSATTRGDATSQGREQDGEKRTGKKKERVQDDDAHRLRKSAKSRVAAWLGGIDPDTPPVDASPLLLPSLPNDLILVAAGPAEDVKAVTADLRKGATEEPAAPATKEAVTSEKEPPAAPNPRSSGFVPIMTLKNDEGRRPSSIKEPTRTSKIVERKDSGVPFVAPMTRVPQSPKVDRIVSPPSDALNVNVPRPPRKKQAFISTNIPQRLPVSPPPPLDPEVKYDIRSARGGRGGRVTAVASIWASQTADNLKPTPVASKPLDIGRTKSPAKPTKSSSPSPVLTPAPEKSLGDLTSRRARQIKSSSVPAMVSSSHATPTLSSTASLARSSPRPDRTNNPIRVLPSVLESQPEAASTASKDTRMRSPQSPKGDLAFGQARLRDLIKKYQGQAA